MTEFSDRPFAMGSLTGVRVFQVDVIGRLRGVSVIDVFTPGENVARCTNFHSQMMWTLDQQMARMAGHATATEHHVGSVRCTCGYYAYYDMAANPYDQAGRVTALVRGYGVCSVGLRGFRAEKARLVALVDPTRRSDNPSGGDWHRRWDRFCDWTYAHDTISIALLVLGGFGAILASISAVAAGSWYLLALLATMPLLVAAASTMPAISHSIDRQYPDIHDLTCPDGGNPKPSPLRQLFQSDTAVIPIPWDLIHRNYPDVPVYASLAEALAEHPVTVPDMPSPDDPGFWTEDVR